MELLLIHFLSSETSVRNLKSDSHFRWTLNREFFSSSVKPEELEIQMMFRTRDRNGVLFTASSTDNTQTITLEVRGNSVLQSGVVCTVFFVLCSAVRSGVGCTDRSVLGVLYSLFCSYIWCWLYR